ncbi:MAG TPA: HAD family hydrolase [Ruminiclostridium sp.]|nr:HAD family hydrolase [Ruminiclostridium sp.]
MKTLYISDLDGTLLNKSAKVSDFTENAVNNLIEKGMQFSYATARSLSSASVITAKLNINMPVIVYNGAFIKNPETGETLYSIKFSEDEINDAANFFRQTEISPLTYSFIEGRERVTWLSRTETGGIKRYLNLRKGDRRLNKTDSIENLFCGDVFYFTCIGKKESLEPVYEFFKNDRRYRCTFQKEIYDDDFWCEVMPKDASKANGVKKLKGITGCEKIIAFGDAINDVPMFEISDECYAVENAARELKKIATAIINSNADDGVANWLCDNFNA